MAEITQTIPSITNIPDRINDTPEQFSENAILSLEQQQTFSAAINTFSGQANAVRDEMVALDSNVTSNASTSAANALSASNSADAAAASESNADADALTASNAASAAESSETSAAASALAASNSQSAAASSETNAASSAATAISNASTSTTNAASALASKNAAAVSEGNAEQSAIEAAQSATNAALQLGSYKGDWVSGIYNLGDSVTYNGYIYIAKKSTSNSPEDDDSWFMGTGTAASYNAVVDADDQTEDRLLKVGATVKQLDLTNSNIEYVPNATALLDLNFVNDTYEVYEGFGKGFAQKPLADIVDFSRSTTGTGIAGNLSLATTSANVPRIVFDPVTGERQGYLSAQSYENMVLQSDDIASSPWAWTKSAPIIGDYIKLKGHRIVPITDDSSTDNEARTQDITGLDTSSTYAFSIVAKYIDSSSSLVTLQGSGVEPTASIHINWNSDGTVASVGSGVFYYEIGDGLYQFWINATTATTAGTASLYIWPAGYVTGGTSTGSTYFGEPQLTKTSTLMPYATTTTSTVVVGADSMSRTLSGDELNRESFTLFWHGYFPEGFQVGSATTGALLGLSDGTYSNGIAIATSANASYIRVHVRVSGANIASLRIVADAGNREIKFAVSLLSDGSIIACANGGNIFSIPTTGLDMSLITTMLVNQAWAGPNFGSITSKQAQILNKSLSDLELQGLTRL